MTTPEIPAAIMAIKKIPGIHFLTYKGSRQYTKVEVAINGDIYEVDNDNNRSIPLSDYEWHKDVYELVGVTE